ncbi:uncharacterized protein METZ01_LOCUS173965, partial [marine metagenome]
CQCGPLRGRDVSTLPGRRPSGFATDRHHRQYLAGLGDDPWIHRVGTVAQLPRGDWRSRHSGRRHAVAVAASAKTRL